MTPSASVRRNWIYWTATAALAAECFVGGVMGALRLQPFKGVVRVSDTNVGDVG